MRDRAAEAAGEHEPQEIRESLADWLTAPEVAETSAFGQRHKTSTIPIDPARPEVTAATAPARGDRRLRIRCRVSLLVGPVGRRDQLARRTGHPSRRRHPQSLWRQPHAQGRRHPAGAGQRRAHRPSTRPRPSSADRHDVARCRSRRPRRIRASAAARVRGATPERPLPKRDRSPRLPAAKDTVQRRHPRLGCRLCAAGVSNGCCARQQLDEPGRKQ